MTMDGLFFAHRRQVASFARACAVLIVALALASCSNVESLRDQAPKPEDFTSSLAFEYLGFADSEREQQRWRSAEYFADKGLIAARGTAPKLEKPEHLIVSEEDQRLLDDAYGRLSLYRRDEAATIAPQALARAQLFYDCWVREVAVDHADVTSADCGAEFAGAMDALETSLVAAGYVLAHEKEVQKSMVAFGAGRVTPGRIAHKKLKKFAEAAKELAAYRVRVIAYADASGDEEKNEILAHKRATAVRDALVEYGLEPSRIIARGGGIADTVEISETALPDRRAELTLFNVTQEK
jgi:outer membrane protein OmpA-like peptidoglycan-associated protein